MKRWGISHYEPTGLLYHWTKAYFSFYHVKVRTVCGNFECQSEELFQPKKAAFEHVTYKNIVDHQLSW